MVVICVPTTFHKEFILKSLRAGNNMYYGTCKKGLKIPKKP